jgi:hypothetical protein
LEPEQPFIIRLAASADDPSKINFCCRIEDHVIAEGKLEVYRGTKVTS